jgi:hypothetical protein
MEAANKMSARGQPGGSSDEEVVEFKKQLAEIEAANRLPARAEPALGGPADSEESQSLLQPLLADEVNEVSKRDALKQAQYVSLTLA